MTAGARERLRVYGRRRGKRLRPTAKALMASLLPRLAITLSRSGRRLDPPALFPRAVRAVWLEIGFGGGEHLAAQAEAHADVGIIGCEFFVNGIASLVGHVERAGLENVRIFPEDARQLFPALPDASLERVFVLFPDPWPKKRHAERRFVAPANLDEVARLLAEGGELRVASDDPTYIEWAVEHLTAHPAFQWLQGSLEASRARPADWPPTRYEAKALAQGRQPAYLAFRRRPRSS